jgi:hypothetical protein
MSPRAIKRGQSEFPMGITNIPCIEAAFLLLLPVPIISLAGAALETVKVHTSDALSVLQDPALRAL